MKLNKIIDTFLKRYGSDFSVLNEVNPATSPCCIFPKGQNDSDFMKEQLSHFGSVINGDFILIFSSSYSTDLTDKQITVDGKKYYVKNCSAISVGKKIIYRYAILAAM